MTNKQLKKKIEEIGWKKRTLIVSVSLGVTLLYGWLLNKVPDIYGNTDKLTWTLGMIIGWTFGFWTAIWIYEHYKK